MQSPETRATQHLLVQGFTLYPCAAAVCTRLVAPSVLDEPNHAWAVLFDADSMRWVAMLPEGDRLRDVFLEAAARGGVICHAQGGLLGLPLVVTDVRDARMRIEAAVALGKAPPAERLEAFSDEALARESERRARRAARERQPSGEKEPQ